MDFSRLQAIVSELNSTSSNITSGSIPSTVLELFIPGYSTIAHLTFRYLKFDMGVLVTSWLALFGLYHGGVFTYGRLREWFHIYYTSSIAIDESDVLFDHVMSWIAVQRMTTSSRHLTAATHWISEVDDVDGDDNVLDEHGIFNYEKWSERWFRFARVKKKDNGKVSDYDEVIVITCVGRNAVPIKDLLVFVKRWSLNKASTTATIYQAPAQKQGGERPTAERQNPWRYQRVSQPCFAPPVVATEDATSSTKAPKTETQEPPKSVVSMGFNILAWPFKLMVLDLGYVRKRATHEEPAKECTVPESPKEPAQGGGKEQSSKSKATSKEASGGAQGTISLSGLLNVIDGAASHEGHVLIMTTNTPEKLDDALTRPGRVDMQMGFTLATRNQICDTYMRMFSNDNPTPDATLAPNVTTNSHIPTQGAKKDELCGILLPKQSIAAVVEPGKLAEMAQQFADALPEKVFSPAEVQGYLLMQKMDPGKAIRRSG
ncbi:hypothetical protein BKA58DRAFT_464360 [Alternaria rosae]|uniref:uncharacterized protein n=1 Tax=Alternaria rosae TaxID=1187941 RepID=UPI001E8ED3B3|nr:uncharacterized protein BKA58DRAFT_464360 [Alternaria rosae]KAH6882396.1 hypothetical protein BKA58DRAFT_464360 [Alternaria rosae]